MYRFSKSILGCGGFSLIGSNFTTAGLFVLLVLFYVASGGAEVGVLVPLLVSALELSSTFSSSSLVLSWVLYFSRPLCCVILTSCVSRSICAVSFKLECRGLSASSISFFSFLARLLLYALHALRADPTDGAVLWEDFRSGSIGLIKG